MLDDRKAALLLAGASELQRAEPP